MQKQWKGVPQRNSETWKRRMTLSSSCWSSSSCCCCWASARWFESGEELGLQKLIKEAIKTLGPKTIALRLERRLLFCVEFKDEVALWTGEELIWQTELNTITMLFLSCTGVSPTAQLITISNRSLSSKMDSTVLFSFYYPKDFLFYCFLHRKVSYSILRNQINKSFGLTNGVVILLC